MIILTIKDLITRIIKEELEKTDTFLVGVDTNQAETDLKFFIDGTEGVSIQLCTKLSRKISGILDEEYTEETPIRYEISSPGVDQPLVDIRQYPQHVGRDFIITLSEEEVLEGELVAVGDDDITLSVLVSKHKKDERVILLENIIKSTVKISFKRKKK
jgi:ribosome maturation factor RimP